MLMGGKSMVVTRYLCLDEKELANATANVLQHHIADRAANGVAAVGV